MIKQSAKIIIDITYKKNIYVVPDSMSGYDTKLMIGDTIHDLDRVDCSMIDIDICDFMIKAVDNVLYINAPLFIRQHFANYLSQRYTRHFDAHSTHDCTDFTMYMLNIPSIKCIDINKYISDVDHKCFKNIDDFRSFPAYSYTSLGAVFNLDGFKPGTPVVLHRSLKKINK